MGFSINIPEWESLGRRPGGVPKLDNFPNPCCPENMPPEGDEIRNEFNQQEHFGSYLLQLLFLVNF
jgi:hypothetical protein